MIELFRLTLIILAILVCLVGGALWIVEVFFPPETIPPPSKECDR